MVGFNMLIFSLLAFITVTVTKVATSTHLFINCFTDDHIVYNIQILLTNKHKYKYNGNGNGVLPV